MKKYNRKQLAYSRKKVSEAILHMSIKFLFIAVMAFAIPVLAHAMNDPTAVKTSVYLLGSPIILFTMANIGNLSKPSDIETAPNQIGFRLWLVAIDQVDDTVAFPTPNANRELGNIPLKSGEYWHHFDGIDKSLRYVATAEKGDVTSTFNKTFTIIIGYSVAALNYLESFQGHGHCLVFKECESETKFELGSFCKPILLNNFEVKQDNEGKYITLTFSNDHWRQPLIYTGSLTEQAPSVIAADATDLAVASGQDTYLLTGGTAAPATIATVSGIASADYGRNITLKAPAAATYPPQIADNSVFILRDGTAFTANPGSSITFNILDSNTLVEVGRIQTA